MCMRTTKIMANRVMLMTVSMMLDIPRRFRNLIIGRTALPQKRRGYDLR